MENLRQGNWLASEQKMLKINTDGKSLIELTTYRGIALWWFIRFRLYHSAESSQLIKSLIKNTFFISFADFLYDFFTSILCRMLSRYSKVKTGEKREFKILITTPHTGWRNIHDRSGRLKKSDVFFDSIITGLKKRNYKIITVYPLGYSVSGLRKTIDRLKRQKGVIHKPFNIYWSIKIWKKEYDARKYFRSIWKNASENSKEFTGLLEKYQLKSELSYYFNSIFERDVKRIEMAKELVKREEPDLILVADEYDVFGRALVIAGKLKGIPTLAIQHGNIGPLHVGYMYSKDNISASGSIQSPYCQIPDKIAVYGPFYYDLLTKTSAFPSSSVVITGQPRYDRLVMSDRIYSREKFCAMLGLDPHRKIVLVATQPIPMRETFIRSVLRALKNFQEAQVIMKLHPGENDEAYKKVVEEENVRVKMLSKSSDTIEALYACDLLVAAFSTVITEALVLGRPAVTLNLTAEDPIPYYKEVTLRVDKEEDLAPAIRKALYDEKTREKLKKERKKFISKYVYKQDGKATERVIGLIERMIKKETMK